MSEIPVIGDDLTGTNATASAYARDGLRAMTVQSHRAGRPRRLRPGRHMLDGLSPHDTRTRRTDCGRDRQKLWSWYPGHRKTV